MRREWDELPRRTLELAVRVVRRRPARHRRSGSTTSSRSARRVIYLTPIFPAGTVHRYDATTFEHIDPLLGGDEGLVTLTKAAHERGIRVVGDLTLNHVGSGHEWFRAAVEDPDSPERGFFYFDDSLPDGYVVVDGRAAPPQARLPLAGAPAADERRARPLDAAALRARRVANRRGEHDRPVPRHRPQPRGGALARGQTLASASPDGLLVAEHMHDARRDLGARGWQGVMNYSGCLVPIWSWLRRGPLEDDFYDTITLPRPGEQVAAEMTLFRSGVPWPAVLHSWTLLSSHDAPRPATVIPSRDHRLVAIGLQMTTPGVPMLFAGDEIGIEGAWGEDGRRTMPVGAARHLGRERCWPSTGG